MKSTKKELDTTHLLVYGTLQLAEPAAFSVLIIYMILNSIACMLLHFYGILVLRLHNLVSGVPVRVSQGNDDERFVVATLVGEPARRF